MTALRAIELPEAPQHFNGEHWVHRLQLFLPGHYGAGGAGGTLASSAAMDAS